MQSVCDRLTRKCDLLDRLNQVRNVAERLAPERNVRDRLAPERKVRDRLARTRTVPRPAENIQRALPAIHLELLWIFAEISHTLR